MAKRKGQEMGGRGQVDPSDPTFSRPQPSDNPLERRSSWIIMLGLSAMFVTSALWHPPDQPSFVLCPFRAATGYPCPGCGMTRAFCALTHGEWRRAIAFNALSPLLYLVLLIVWAHAMATLLNLRGVRETLSRLQRPTPLVGKLALALVMLWWVARLVGGF